MKASRQTLVAAMAYLCATGGVVDAQEVRFLGSTTGCFFTTGTCTPAGSAALFDLSFSGGSFDAWTTNGTLVVGSTTNNLGTFTLGSVPLNYNTGWNFLLNVAFQLPTLTNPDAVYNALIGGIVVNDELGTVHIMFDETPQVFSYNGPDNQAGSFTLTVPEFGVPVGEAVPVAGYIETTATPEPATMALVATGLAGLIPAARRRRRKPRE